MSKRTSKGAPAWTQTELDAYCRKHGFASPGVIARVDIPPTPLEDDGMNKTERAYSCLLNARISQGEIMTWAFEPVTFKLAPRTTYTPDFMVVCTDRIEFHEVKGAKKGKTGKALPYVMEDAAVKIKTCSAMMPFFRWYYVFRIAGGEWTYKEIPRR